jgi:GNAT superfamily N-acetyltransferase
LAIHNGFDKRANDDEEDIPSSPYIHIIAVKSESRGQGIGKMLLKFVENVYYQNYSKLFLEEGSYDEAFSICTNIFSTTYFNWM